MPRARHTSRRPFGRPSRLGGERDLLRPFPQHALAKLLQPLVAFEDRGEVVAGQLACLAREKRPTVRKEDLRLADAARVEQQWPGPGVARVVLVAEAELELAERDPRSLSAPAGLDELGLERQHRLERLACPGRRVGLEPGEKAQVSDGDLEVHALTKIAPLPSAGSGARKIVTTPAIRPFRLGWWRVDPSCCRRSRGRL